MFLVLSYLAGVWIVYTAAYAARFQDSAKTTIRQSGLLALASPAQSILLLVGLGIIVFVLPVFPPLIVFLPGVYCWIAHKALEKVFEPFIP